MSSYRLRVRKERLGFSAAHFTLFEDGRAERLHGHNYRADIEIEGEELQGGLLVDFTDIKKALQNICSELDERTLLPTDHEDLLIERHDGSIEVRYQDRRYLFPEEDVCLLPLVNTTVEELARHVGRRLVEELGPVLRAASVRRLTVGIEETPGQEGRYETCP